MDISLRRLNRSSVAAALYKPEGLDDALILRIGQDEKVTLTDGASNTISSITTVNNTATGAQNFHEKLQALDTVAALNLISQWSDQLHQNARIETDKALSEAQIAGLFPAAGSVPTRPTPGIVLSSKVMKMPVTVGFDGFNGGHNISTYILPHPTNPATGVTFGPVYIEGDDGAQAPYAFRFSSTSHDAYTVSMFPLDDMKVEESLEQGKAALLLDVDPDTFISMTVTCEKDKIKAVVNNWQKREIVNKEHTFRWSNNSDRVSMIPLGGSRKNIHLPGVGACMNILAHGISEGMEGSIADALDATHMEALVTPQVRGGYKDGAIFSGAYRSNVPRNFEKIAPLRKNAVSPCGNISA